MSNLVFVSPESLGIPSGAVREFLCELEEKRLCMHGFLMLRHGKVAAEAYWQPFNANRKHRMYSISKSFTSIAIGMMIEAGKISLESKVSDLFPEYMPNDPHEYLLETTVRDLLMMATCNRNPSYSDKTHDFAQSFFADTGPKHKPGQVFYYDTAATVVLCSIVEKLSGKKMLEYMKPVLDEIGFSQDAYCIEAPDGSSWTGSGILCTPRDLACFALLCLNGGEWNGKQLVNRDFVHAATSWQIDTSVSAANGESRYGYGYQFWRLRKGGFAMIGMGGQFAVCMPENGTILITTADSQGTEGAADILLDAYYRLADKLSPDALPEDATARDMLNEKISKLTIPQPIGRNSTQLEIPKKKYILDENEAGFKWLRFYKEENKCRLQYENKTGEHELVFGMGEYLPGLFPEKYYGRRIGTKDTNYQCICAGAWADDKTFLGTVYSVDDHLGSVRLQLTFSDEKVSVYMVKAAEWFFDGYQGFLSGKLY